MNPRILSVAMAMVTTTFSFTQSQVVISDNAFIVMTNNAKLVIDNSNTNAISTLGTGGNIVTESELNQIIWKIGTATGTYVIPFTSHSTFTKIPFTATITSPGTGDGEIRFSTYSGATWDNNTYRPSDVTPIYDFNSGIINNSDNVIDRFWIIDPVGYTTIPDATLTFTYCDEDYTQVGNTITESNLVAQQFNGSINRWRDYVPQASTNTATNTISGVFVTGENFFRSWTLGETLNPVSNQLTYFIAPAGKDQSILFNWETPSQSNTDHFEIEHYLSNGFEVIGTIPAENAAETHTYTYETTTYRTGVFRLVEIDDNGNRIPHLPVTISCENRMDPIVSYNNEYNSLYLQFEGEFDGIEFLQLVDATGRIVYSSDFPVLDGINSTTLPEIYLNSGYYHVRMMNGKHLLSESVFSSH